MNFVNKYISQLSFAVFIIIWQLCVIGFKIPEYILPSPTKVIYTLISNIKLIAIHTSYTLFEAVLGILIAIVLGVITAIVLYRHQTLKRIFMPYINILQTIPAIVIAPLFAMWFGFGLFPKILLIVIFCSFPIIVSTVASFSQVDNESILYLKSLKCNDWYLFKHLYLPAASKSIFASIKISTTYSLVNAIFAEYMGAKFGLGVYLNKASSSFSTPDVFAIIIVIIVVTLSLLKVVDIIESKVIRWD